MCTLDCYALLAFSLLHEGSDVVRSSLGMTMKAIGVTQATFTMHNPEEQGSACTNLKRGLKDIKGLSSASHAIWNSRSCRSELQLCVPCRIMFWWPWHGLRQSAGPLLVLLSVSTLAVVAGTSLVPRLHAFCIVSYSTLCHTVHDT